jgi:hypothetical protein
MKRLRQLLALFRKEKLDAEMAEEMRHHFDAQKRWNLTGGMPLDDARCVAQREFCDLGVMREAARGMRDFESERCRHQPTRFPRGSS